MLINVQTESPSSPAFYVKIRHGLGENIYVCQKAGAFSTSISCNGEPVPVGEKLQFLMLSRRDDNLLAEG